MHAGHKGKDSRDIIILNKLPHPEEAMDIQLQNILVTVHLTQLNLLFHSPTNVVKWCYTVHPRP